MRFFLGGRESNKSILDRLDAQNDEVQSRNYVICSPNHNGVHEHGSFRDVIGL